MSPQANEVSGPYNTPESPASSGGGDIEIIESDCAVIERAVDEWRRGEPRPATICDAVSRIQLLARRLHPQSDRDAIWNEAIRQCMDQCRGARTHAEEVYGVAESVGAVIAHSRIKSLLRPEQKESGQ